MGRTNYFFLESIFLVLYRDLVKNHSLYLAYKFLQVLQVKNCNPYPHLDQVKFFLIESGQVEWSICSYLLWPCGASPSSGHPSPPRISLIAPRGRASLPATSNLSSSSAAAFPPASASSSAASAVLRLEAHPLPPLPPLL